MRLPLIASLALLALATVSDGALAQCENATRVGETITATGAQIRKITAAVKSSTPVAIAEYDQQADKLGVSQERRVALMDTLLNGAPFKKIVAERAQAMSAFQGILKQLQQPQVKQDLARTCALMPEYLGSAQQLMATYTAETALIRALTGKLK